MNGSFPSLICLLITNTINDSLSSLIFLLCSWQREVLITTMSAINLHRWPILKTTGINIETQELILKYYKLPDQLSKLHINHPAGGGGVNATNWMSKTGKPGNKKIGKMIICILHKIHASNNFFIKKLEINKLLKLKNLIWSITFAKQVLICE